MALHKAPHGLEKLHFSHNPCCVAKAARARAAVREAAAAAAAGEARECSATAVAPAATVGLAAAEMMEVEEAGRETARGHL